MTIVPEKLHHVSRQTRKLEETRRFYIEVLGFRELSSRPNFNFGGAWLYGAGIQIHLIDEPFPDPPVEINSRENHIAFRIHDMNAAEQVLKDRGIVYRRQTVPERNSDQIFFRDPEGWMIELGPYPNPIDR
jgi:catechol 2,3-dioxygenase-like lactoylglutathione lyase family enzyme